MRILYLFVFAVLSLPCMAQEEFPADRVPEISTSVSEREVSVGDVITYTISVEHEEGVSVTTLHQEIAQSDFFLRDIRIETPTVQDDGRISQLYVLELTTFNTGEFEIPPIPVRYQLVDSPDIRGQQETPAVPITVASLTEEEVDNLSIRDIKPQETVEGESWLGVILLVAALILLIIGLIAWFVYRMMKPKTLPAAPPRPAHEVALEALQALRQDRDIILNHDVERLSVRVSEIIRIYIQHRFGFPAPDYTTHEIIHALNAQGEAKEVIVPLQRLFEQCDLIKFARHDLAQDGMLPLIEQAERWIEQTTVSSAPTKPDTTGEAHPS